MSTIEQILTRAAATLFPPTCCLCGGRGVGPVLDLCEICRAALPRHRQGSATNVSGRPLGASFPLVVVPFLYAYPVAHLVRALKFRGERAYARVLGSLLADARRAFDAPTPECIVPVPLHPSRYRERGFNQSHELARHAAAQLGLRVDGDCLVRVRETREQSGLSVTERRRNVSGAFRAVRPPTGQRVALVDDVLTTGSTVRAAALALRRAGVEEIELWAVARAVLHDSPSAEAVKEDSTGTR